MKISREALKQAIDEAQSIVLTVHVNPDGDAIGSMIGFYEALVGQGKDVRMVVDDVIPAKYGYLNHIDKIEPVKEGTAAPDMIMVLDASTFERIGAVGQMWPEVPLYNIDHHISNTDFAKGLYLLPDYAATGEIIADLCQDWGWPLSPNMANALYMAIGTDTGFYKFSNTTSHTLRMGAFCVEQGAQPNVVSEHVELCKASRIEAMHRALGNVSINVDKGYAIMCLDPETMALTAGDSDGFVDLIRNVEGVDVAVVLKAKTTDATRVSFRSKTVDVNALAAKFGGGGHIRAAGCTIAKDLAGAKAAVEEVLQ